RRKPRVRLEPVQTGGGQERGLRSGTGPTPLIVGLGEACEVAARDIDYDYKHVVKLANHFLNQISGIEHIIRNGHPEKCYLGCINLSFAYIEGESLLMALKDI